MKTKSPRTWLSALILCLAATVFVTVTGWLLASPADDITKALSANGTTNAQKVGAAAFLDAFTSVLVETDPSETAAYVSAATTLRPDLKDQITAAATEVDSVTDDSDTEPDRHRVSRHRRRVHICCRGHTIVLPPAQARRYLATHPECTRGACRHQTPPPHR